MIITIINVVVLTLIGAGVWWLTGFDKGYDGQSKKDHHFPRLLRTGLVLLAVGMFMWVAEYGAGLGGISILCFGVFILVIALRSSVAEVFTHGFMRMVDPYFHESGPYDPQKTQRYIDTIGHLIRTGQREQAIKLCEEFKKTGEVDRVTLENTLEYLGVRQDRSRASTPLAVARKLRAGGQFIEAAATLKTHLEKNPRDTESAMTLMRIYAQDLHQRGLADEVLKNLQAQSHVYAGHIEFARRSLNEWSTPDPVRGKETAPAAPQSIDDALAQGFVGTAVERLELQVRDQPSNFEARLKLIEVQAVYCQNLPRATKLLQQLAADPWFTPEQVQVATARLKDLYATASRPNGSA